MVSAIFTDREVVRPQHCVDLSKGIVIRFFQKELYELILQFSLFNYPIFTFIPAAKERAERKDVKHNFSPTLTQLFIFLNCS